MPGRHCPKCAFEGKENYLSEPYETEEGMVQECPVHGRLYVWLHVYATPEGEVVPLEGDPLFRGKGRDVLSR